MKKLAYVAGLGLALCMLNSCEDEHKNPCDFSVKDELELNDVINSILDSARSYQLIVKDRRDTTYARQAIKYDTVFRYLENGDSDYVYGADGKVLVNKDTVIVYSKKTAAMVEYEPVVFGPEADTVEITLKSNARWMAKQPESDKALWLYNANGTEAGGGDSHINLTFGTLRKQMKQRGPVYQYVFTSDSLVCYKIPFYQAQEGVEIK